MSHEYVIEGNGPFDNYGVVALVLELLVAIGSRGVDGMYTDVTGTDFPFSWIFRNVAKQEDDRVAAKELVFIT